MHPPRPRLRLRGLAAALVIAGLAAAPAAAQMSFDGGSFGSGGGGGSAGPSGPPTSPPPAPGSEPGGSFGGSFGAPGSPPGPTPGAQPAPGGFGGSFDTPGPGTPSGPPSGPPAGPPQGGPVAPPPVVQMPPGPQPQPLPPPPPASGIRVDPQILAFESRDFGVPPSGNLHPGPFHAVTPVALPGAQLISTEALASAMNEGQYFVLIDVLGGDYALPQAYSAPALASPGDFSDRTQQQAAQWLAQITGNNKDVAVVVYCSDPMCWLSYNAALRVVAAGYRNVYWYRGGLQAWQMAGLPLQPSGF